ncbi:MAG TPA: tetratricopeptide repeat protein [Bacteroidota bacterium]
MNTGPYSDEKTQQYIEKEFIPLKSQVNWKNRTELMKTFSIKWTPTFLVQDSEAAVHERFVGFVPVDDLLARLGLGKGKVFFNQDHYAQAIEQFRSVVEQHPASGSAPEAVFLLGVSEYWKTHKLAALRRIYDTLIAQYPQSEWARRAMPYSGISP